MPVMGIETARRKTKALTANISDRKVQRAITAALITGAGFAAIMTPVDTSFLINSQFRRIDKVGGGWRGQVGYTAAYAAAVHSPTVKQTFKKKGAEKEFLKKGFEDNRDKIDAAVKKVLAL